MADKTTSADLEATSQHVKLIESAAAKYRELNEGKRQSLDLTNAENAALQTLAASERATVEQLQVRLTAARELLAVEKETSVAARDYRSILDLNNKYREAEVAMLDRRANKEREALAAAVQHQEAVRNGSEAQRQAAAAAVQSAREQYRNTTKTTTALRDQGKAYRDIQGAVSNVLKTTTGISGAWQQTSWGAASQAADGIKAVGTAAGYTLSPLNILGSTLMKIQESTVALIVSADKLGAAFAKQTGLMGRNTDALQRNLYATTNIRATLDELSQSHAALATQSSRFIDLTRGESDALMQLSTAMDKAGYGANFVASNLDTLMIGLGRSASEVERFMRSMDGMRQQVGISVAQFQKDFPAALKTAMFYTGQMEQELTNLMRAAKATGLEMAQLQGVVAQYDTFTGSAEAVGRLNAILGGPYLNAIQMVYASESERIELLRSGVAASGRAFADLERYEKKAIMAAAGINDINTALQLFGQGANAYNAHLQKQKELEELARQATPVLEQLRALGLRLAVSFKPFVSVLEKFVRALEMVTPKTTAAAGAMTGVLVAAFISAANSARATAAAIVSSSMQIVTALNTEAAAAGRAASAHGNRAAAAGAAGMRGRGRLGRAAGLGAGVYGAATGDVGMGVLGGGLYGGSRAGIPGAIGGAVIGGGIAAARGAMAAGGTSRGGSYLVGERGPEVVSMPQGSNVMTNENVGRVMAASAGAAEQMSQMTVALKSSLDNLAGKLNSIITIDERNANRDRGNVVRLELDRRILGETIVDYLNEESELSLIS